MGSKGDGGCECGAENDGVRSPVVAEIVQPTAGTAVGLIRSAVPVVKGEDHRDRAQGRCN
jgi:hypothetical protein